MKELHHTEKVFDKVTYTNQNITGREFDACTFTNCDLSGSNFSGTDFIDCKFEGCNLSMVQLGQTGLKSAAFHHCKLLGVDFSPCNEFLFAVHFEHCILDYSSFFKRKLRKTIFEGCSIKEANFTQTDLSGASFSNCDLSGTVFQQTILEKADFRSASNFSIDPEVNRIKKARFSLTGLTGLLDKYDLVVE